MTQQPLSSPTYPPHWIQPTGSAPLYSVAQIALATFLGSPLAGTILMALNYRRLDPDKSVPTVVLGVLASAILVALALVLPDSFPSFVLPAAYTAVVAFLAEKTQGVAIRDAKTAGEPIGSSWRVVGVGLGTLVLILVVLFGVLIMLPEDKVTFGSEQQQEIYFEQGATEQDARKVHAGLSALGVFGNQAATATIKREKGGWLVTVVVPQGAWEDAETLAFFEEVARGLSEQFDGETVRIALANNYLIAKKTVGPKK